MLTKLKCFFEWHEWEYSDQGGPHHGRVLRKRKCKCCEKHQRMTIITSLTPESSKDMESKYPVWINTVPDKPTPQPKPKSLKQSQIDFRCKGVQEMGKAISEARRPDSVPPAPPSPPRSRVIREDSFHKPSKLPKINVDTPMPECKETKLDTIQTHVFDSEGKRIGVVTAIEGDHIKCDIYDRRVIDAIQKPFNMSIGFKMEMDDND